MRNKFCITLFCLAAALWHYVLAQPHLQPSDTDRCLTNNGGCDSTNGLCWATGDNLHFCTCKAGYEEDLTTLTHHCIDANECDDNPCGDNADCVNTHGSFECKCHCGYIQDYTGLHCLDAMKIEDACQIPSTCVPKRRGFIFGARSVPFDTKNSAGYYTSYAQYDSLLSTGWQGWLWNRRTCSCEAGFEFNGCGYCVDKNECYYENPCSGFNSRCVNTEGSYYCTCDNGYILGPCRTKCYRPNDRTRPQLCGESNLESLKYTGFSYRTWNRPIVLNNYRNCPRGVDEGDTTEERHDLDFNDVPDIILTWVCSTGFGPQSSALKNYAEAEAYWTQWSCWTACKATCWGGLQTRVRMCKNGLPGNEGCKGKGSEKKECYTGPKCAYRVRKDAATLTRTERNDLLQAMKKYKEDMTTRGFHSAASAHGWPFQCDRESCCPHGARVEFMAWHRTIMLNYEEGLSRYMRNKNLGIPYWNWLRTDRSPPALGWNRFFNGEENPFANMTVLIDQTGPMRTIQRDSTVFTDVLDFAEQTWREVALRKVRPHIMHEFAESLESAHGGPHVSVCGEGRRTEKCAISLAVLDFAGFDPLFMMHHSQVDRLWAIAQKKMEDAGEETWSTQSALESLEPEGNFGQRHVPFGNTTLNPFPKVQAVNTMRDSYYYKELTGIAYDDLNNDGYPSRGALVGARALRTGGAEALFVGHYFQSDPRNFYVNYYDVTRGPTACNQLSTRNRLGGALRLGTSRPFRLTIPHLVQIGEIAFLDVDMTVKACYTADPDCRERCPELSTENIRIMPDPHLVYYTPNTPVDIYKFQWETGRKMPNWYINLDARSQWIYFFGNRRGNIRQVQRGSDYLSCNSRRGRAFNCGEGNRPGDNSACALPTGIYYLIDSDSRNCRAGLKLIVVSRMDN